MPDAHLPADPDDAVNGARVLVLAPLGRDAAVVAEVIGHEGLTATQCTDVGACCAEVARGAEALIVTEEALDVGSGERLAALLRAQPPWSDLPVIMLVRGGEARRIELLRVLGPASGAITLLERPMHPLLLASALRAAMRARARQYETRDLLVERQRVAESLRESRGMLQSFYDSSPFFMGVAELDGDRIRVVQGNRAVANVVGMSLEALLGRSAEELGTPPEIERLCIERYRQALQEGRPVRFELDYPAPEGVRTLSAAVAHLETSAQGRSRFSFVAEDVTERRRSEQAVRDSEAQLAAVLDNIAEGVVVTDPDSRFVYWNRAAHAILALDEARDAGMPLETRAERVRLETAAGEAVPIGQWPVARVLRGESLANVEYGVRLLHTGTELVLSFSGALLRDAAGRPWRSIIAFADVTERARAERALRAELEERERILDALPAAVWVAHDPHCLTITGNSAASELVGAQPGSNVSQTAARSGEAMHIRQLKPDGTEYSIDELPLQRALATGQDVAGAEIEFLLADGRRVWTVGNAIPLFDRAGAVRGGLAAFLDVTPLKQAQAALAEADRRKDEFLALLAHELRNLLAPMRNAAQILRLAADDPVRTEQAVGVMERQVHAMVGLVDDLLDLARIARGGVKLCRERLDLAAVVAAAVEISRPLIEEHAHVLEIRQPREPVPVDGDPTRLTQVLVNLLNNAARYTGRGGRITLELARSANEAELTVTDNGIGIAPEIIPRVFEMFAQFDERGRTAHGGLGVGLALVRALVELHGGRVWAASDGPGRGASFTVCLPLARSATLRAEHAPAAASRGPTLRVLVADDNRDAATSLCLLLEMLGHDVRKASDGEEAVRTAEAFRPQVVFMDLGMPVMDGYEATRRIRASAWGRTVWIVALTGWGQDADRDRARAAGCDAHLVKPVDINALERWLAEAAADEGRSEGRDAPA
jgi:PAS domain S-box-containing protein